MSPNQARLCKMCGSSSYGFQAGRAGRRRHPFMGKESPPSVPHVVNPHMLLRRTGPAGIISRPAAGWSSQAARRAHNPKVVGSNPTPATRSLISVPEARSTLSPARTDWARVPPVPPPDRRIPYRIPRTWPAGSRPRPRGCPRFGRRQPLELIGDPEHTASIRPTIFPRHAALCLRVSVRRRHRVDHDVRQQDLRQDGGVVQ